MNEKESNYITVGKAAKLSGLESQTIRKMADTAVIKSYRTPSGQRRINLQSIQELCSNVLSNNPEPVLQKKNFLYARVSTSKQMDDLSRQVNFIRSTRPEYSDYYLVTDVASGINFKRRGLSTILEACLQGCIGEIVIAHRDRLCRFGYDLIDTVVSKAGGKIIVLEESTGTKTDEQELTEDLLSIIHVFSCRQMGKRSYANRSKNKDKNSTDQTSSNEGTTEND